MRCFFFKWMVPPLNLSDLQYKMIGSTKITVFKNVGLFICDRSFGQVLPKGKKKTQLLMLWSGSNELPPALVTTGEGEWGFLLSLHDNLDKGTDAHSCKSFFNVCNEQRLCHKEWPAADVGSTAFDCNDYNTFCHLNLIKKCVFLRVLCGICWINPGNNDL